MVCQPGTSPVALSSPAGPAEPFEAIEIEVAVLLGGRRRSRDGACAHPPGEAGRKQQASGVRKR